MKPINNRRVFAIIVVTVLVLTSFMVPIKASPGKVKVEIRTVNLNDEPVPNLNLAVYNITNMPVDTGRSNGTGWAVFYLDPGNYTFKVFKVDKQVSVTQKEVTGNITFTLECQLAHINIGITDEEGNPLPHIAVTVSYNFTYIDGRTLSEKESLETNMMGNSTWRNMPVNNSWTIKARRQGLIFNKTFVENLTALVEDGWANLTIICPSYTLPIQVADFKGDPIPNVKVGIYEKTGTFLQEETADNSGNVIFHQLVGKYEIRVYNYSSRLKETVILAEETVDLTGDLKLLIIQSRIFNLNISVFVRDRFGQPVQNAVIKIKRENVLLATLTTDSEGKVSLNGIIGGKYQISAYIADKPYESVTLYINKPVEITIKTDRYVVLIGYFMEVSQLVTLTSLFLIAIAFGLPMLYRKFKK